MTTRAGLQPANRRETAILAAAVLGTAGLAWLYLTDLGPGRGEPATVGGPGPFAALALAFSMWTVMMVAMMLPPSLPWVVTFARLTGGTALRRRGRTAAFLAGYGSVWGGYALVAATAQVLLQQAELLVAPGPALPVRLGGAVVVGAGVFQFLPLKAACLSQCRSPVSFFLMTWRDGPRGAFQMGLAHGRHCVGCCWALMAAAFALGVMNLAWMAALTVVMCVEKLLPGGVALGKMLGAVAVVLGGWMLVHGP